MTPARGALGPFTLEAIIAEGGMGRVWAGRHREQGLAVAIKVLAGARSERAKAALWAEARAVARIDHPGVIRLLDVGEVPPDFAARVAGHAPPVEAPSPFTATATSTPAPTSADASTVDAMAPGFEPPSAGSPYLVMERADGTLADAARGGMPLAEALDALRAVLAGLAAAHARGIVHRDVKPANVLRIGRRWVLADFGVAAAVDGVVGARAGTPLYMAPEQLDGDARAQGPWTDLYAVGCLTHALLGGGPPFPGPDRAAIEDGHRFGPPPPLPAGLPPHLGPWVERLLAKDPARRFQCAADARAALDQAPVTVAGWRRTVVDPPFDVVGAGLGLYAHRVLPLAGRVAERDALWSALEAVHATGDLRLALVIGAPGIGKTRLARWFVERAAERGLARVVRTVGDQPLGDAVAEAMNLGARPPPDRATHDAVARALADSGPMADEVAAIARLAAGVGGTPASRAAAMASWLGLWAGQRPVIWWIDDAHRAAEAIDTVRRCLAFDEGAGLPVLVVLTAPEATDDGLDGAPLTGLTAPGADFTAPRRADALLDLMRRPQTTAVVLDPLPPLDARRLVRDLLHLDGAVADALERRAAGHPGFAVQWVADRIEQGALVAGRHGFEPAPGAPVDVPLDLPGIWAARARSLSHDPPAERLLACAAALGPEVDGAIWRALADDPAEAERLRARWLRRGVIRLVPGPRDRWRFVHGPLVEAIAARSMRAGRWPAINRAVAEAVEASAAPEPALLARLHRIGEQPARAIGPLLDAAAAAIERGAYAATLALLDARRALLDGPDPGLTRAALLRLRALRHLSRPDEALAVAERLGRDPPADVADRVQLRIEWSAALRRRGRLDEAIACMSPGVDEARASGQPGLIALACARLARQLTFACRFAEAAPLLDEAEQAATDGDQRAQVLFARALLACQTRDFDAAHAALTEAQALWAALGDLHPASDCLGQLAEVARARGDLKRAFELSAEGIRLARLAGVSLAAPLLNHGLLALDLGDAREARRLLRRATGGLQQAGNTMVLPFAKIGRLHAAALLGDAEEWDEALAIEGDMATRIWPEVPDMLKEIIGLAERVGFDATALVEARERLLADK